MNIAILGCGYVGKALAVRLKNDGHSLTGTTRSPQKASLLSSHLDRVEVLHGNDKAAMENLLKGQQAIILCQAADNASDYETTYLDTAKTLVKLLPSFPGLRHIIYTSSTSVYGDHQGAIVDEESLPVPLNPTSQILLETENVLLASAENTCVLRLGEIVGPGREIADRLRKLEGRPLPGTGDNITNITHVDDIVGFVQLVLTKGLRGIYNICGDQHLPRKELYAHICAEEGLPPVTWDGSKTSRHGGNKIVSNAKAKAAGYVVA